MNKYFVGIGVAKAGTTWLAEYFKSHPEVCFSPVKEMHYFDVKFLDHKQQIKRHRINEIKKSAKNLSYPINKKQLSNLKSLLYLTEMYTNPKAYHQYFNWLKTNEKICGEITPKYALLPQEGFKEIKSFLNNPKIIIVLRNPIERYWSHIRFHQIFFPNINFEKYYIKSFENKAITGPSSYQILLPILYNVFDKGQIHIIFYEHLFDEKFKENTLKEMCSFLEINFFNSMIDKKTNASIEVNLNEQLRLFGIKKLNESYKYIYNTFNKVPISWVEDFKKIS